MDIEITPNNIKNAYVLWYNVSLTDYSLIMETENGDIMLERVSKDSLRVILKAIDIFFKEGI